MNIQYRNMYNNIWFICKCINCMSEVSSANNNTDLGYTFCIHTCLYNMYAFKACHKIVDNLRRESVTVGTTFLYLLEIIPGLFV
jgi:hypothetical protein